jgi:AcrR family transcriptional regulator
MQEAQSDTTNRVLDAAIDVIDRYGLARFTMEDVGRAAGLARQTVYRYYPSRTTLIEAVIRRQEDRLLAGLEAEFAAADTLADAIRGGAQLTVSLLNANTVLTSLLEREPGDTLPYLTTGAARTIDRTGAAVRTLFERRTSDQIPRHTVESAADAFVRLIVSYILTPQDLTDRQIADRITAVLVPALSED